MTRRMTLAFVMGSALLLGSGATVKAAREGFPMAPHFSAPHSGVQRIAPVAPFRMSHPTGSRGFAFRPGFNVQRPDLRSDQGFRRAQRRFPNRADAPLWA